MKYKCTHCNHVFETGEPDVRHCPKCFWTTSLVPFEDAQTANAPADAVTAPVAQKSPAGGRQRFVFLLLSLLLIAAVVFAAVSIFSKRSSRHAVNPNVPTKLSENQEPASITPSGQPTQATSPQDVFATLSNEDKQVLGAHFEITSPRKLTADEEEILKKQVSLPVVAEKPPAFPMWTKEDFKAFLKREQDRRKIPLGGFYNRHLNKLFDEHYLAAGKLVSAGDYAMAREELFKALAFPVYQNDVKLHRAVALVMLKDYINDVIGKIAVLNQYLLQQRLMGQIQSLTRTYQELLQDLDLRNWDGSIRLIRALRDRIISFEDESKNVFIGFPPSFAGLDQDLKAGIQRAVVTSPEKTFDLKGLSVDLDLKEKVVNQNTPDSLAGAQKQYEQAYKLIEEKNWQDAYQRLGEITYPPELIEEAKKKAAVIEKMLAANQPAVNQNSGADSSKAS